MGIGDIRYTVLQVVNEVQRKLGLTPTPTLATNVLATQMVDFINDVCNDLSDFGDWQEVLVSSNVTAVSGRRDYSINTSANIKNIGDIYINSRRGPLRSITVDDMRIISRSSTTGTPSQFTVFQTDNNGNPMLRMYPIPGASDDGSIFSIIYYIRTPSYTISDANTIIPFPARIVVMGTLARALLNESEGASSDRYTLTQKEYLQARKEALNRFNGDTGWNIQFSPAVNQRRRS